MIVYLTTDRFIEPYLEDNSNTKMSEWLGSKISSWAEELGLGSIKYSKEVFSTWSHHPFEVETEDAAIMLKMAWS